ncbi:Protein of uncharacterised function (DUF551) [Enterobacter ludwigii]|uniref:DUF551 domain-containing protein n=1 Tax=Enterobacter ludwigii TaxID=299767 RepID=UPI00125AC56C|nr:DUF551 domain-containing protein [Enterobacter ludwigii]VAG26206.1 Protein of uncharacterised function (DUF551) [Enterobacter ludwigii]
MSTITRERLLKIQQWRETYGPGSNVVLPAEEAEELARIALELLDAEPVAWTDADELRDVKNAGNGYLFAIGGEANKFADPHRQVLLYTAPRAPTSVPDEIEPAVEAIKRVLPTSNPDEYAACIGADMWNACRAAMLHGADGNSPVIPDGWVPCSERMPSVGEKVLAYRPDAPESNDPLIKMAKYVGKSAHGHGFDCYCKPSHWMLLPSAPQQEVKNG